MLAGRHAAHDQRRGLTAQAIEAGTLGLSTALFMASLLDWTGLAGPSGSCAQWPECVCVGGGVGEGEAVHPV